MREQWTRELDSALDAYIEALDKLKNAAQESEMALAFDAEAQGEANASGWSMYRRPTATINWTWRNLAGGDSASRGGSRPLADGGKNGSGYSGERELRQSVEREMKTDESPQEIPA